MSKIAAIRTEVVVLPKEPPMTVAGRQVRFVDNVVVHIETDDGATGSGYVWCIGPRDDLTPPPHGGARLIEAAVRYLEPFLVGLDVFAHEKAFETARGAWLQLNRGVLAVAHSGIDMAMWDAKCKILGQPLYRVLGAELAPVPYYSNELVNCSGRPSREFVTLATQLKEDAGHRALKMPFMGGVPAERENLERVRAVREAIGFDVDLTIDVGSQWDVEQAVRLESELADLRLRWIEDPVHIEDLPKLRHLHEKFKTPIGTGELSCSLPELYGLLHARCLDLMIFEPMRIGGVTGSIKAVAAAAAAGIPVAVHTYPDLAAHLMLAAENSYIAEYLPWWEAMFKAPIQITDGFGTPLDEPGIGFSFDPDALAHYRVGSA